MAGCTKEKFTGRTNQKDAGRKEKFEASKRMKGAGHCWMHKVSKKRTPSKKRSSMKGKKGKKSKKSKKGGRK